MSMNKYILALMFVVGLYPVFGYRLVYGDDTEIYALQKVPPNVLIILDHF